MRKQKAAANQRLKKTALSCSWQQIQQAQCHQHGDVLPSYAGHEGQGSFPQGHAREGALLSHAKVESAPMRNALLLTQGMQLNCRKEPSIPSLAISWRRRLLAGGVYENEQPQHLNLRSHGGGTKAIPSVRLLDSFDGFCICWLPLYIP
jgi:hypothetical protein